MKPNVYSPYIYCSLTVLYNEHITMITLWLCFDIILYFCVHVMVLYPILHDIYILKRRRNRGRWLLFSKKNFRKILDNSSPPPSPTFNLLPTPMFWPTYLYLADVIPLVYIEIRCDAIDIFLTVVFSSSLSYNGVCRWRAYMYFCPAFVVFHKHNQESYLNGSLLVLRQTKALLKKIKMDCVHMLFIYMYM